MEPTAERAEPGVRLHHAVRDLLQRHLDNLDRTVPGLLDGLYLTGSIALGDYRHGISDVDFLAITTRVPDQQDLTALAALHRNADRIPQLDGIYLDRDALRIQPDNQQAVPHSVNGVFHPDRPCGELNPVLWLTLARHGVRIRGPRTAALRLRVDPQRLRTWNLDNLKAYWQPLAAQIRQAVTGREPDAMAPAEGVTWAVLGPARLHRTLASGDIIAKTAAGRHVGRYFPRWAGLAERAVDWRAGRGADFVTTDALAAADLIDAVVADAWQRWG